MSNIEKALELARKYHSGQVDKAGKPYINHILRVAENCKTEKQKIVALLHDIIEDTEITKEDLYYFGFNQEVVEAVGILTKRSDILYDDYIRRIRNNELARQVKICDLKDNSDLSRLKRVTEQDIKRASKYRKALAFLVGKDS